VSCDCERWLDVTLYRNPALAGVRRIKGWQLKLHVPASIIYREVADLAAAWGAAGGATLEYLARIEATTQQPVTLQRRIS
jgi:hypothetical protein